MKACKGKIIFLNGPTSSGKSSLAKMLQSKLPEPYLHIGIDKLIGMMPHHLNNWNGEKAEEGFWWEKSYDSEGNILQKIQLGSFAKKISAALKDVVLTFANKGFNIIVDEVCLSNEGYRNWQSTLETFDVFYIGVKAPLKILLEREILRKDRMLNSARAQFQTVHKNNIYDLEIDTSTNSLEECAEILIKFISANNV